MQKFKWQVHLFKNLFCHKMHCFACKSGQFGKLKKMSCKWLRVTSHIMLRIGNLQSGGLLQQFNSKHCHVRKGIMFFHFLGQP